MFYDFLVPFILVIHFPWWPFYLCLWKKTITKGMPWSISKNLIFYKGISLRLSCSPMSEPFKKFDKVLSFTGQEVGQKQWYLSNLCFIISSTNSVFDKAKKGNSELKILNHCCSNLAIRRGDRIPTPTTLWLYCLKRFKCRRSKNAFQVEQGSNAGRRNSI